MKIEPRTVARLVLLGAATLLAGAATAQEKEAAAMRIKYAGSYETDQFLKEPPVRAELQRLLGAQRGHLQQNLNVAGGIDLVGGVLSFSGNAPHKGTEEEAVVCVIPPGKVVEAAIFSRGAVTVFAKDAQYDNVSLCIKDWITLANSRHADRMKQPRNVRVITPR